MSRAEKSLGLGILAALIAAGGCSSQEGRLGGFACPDLAVPPPQLLYPIPGSTGVADDVGIIVFARISDFPQGKIVLIKTPGATSVPATATQPPDPLPTPIATPMPEYGMTQAATFGPLAAGSTYGVVFDYGQTGPCALGNSPMGSFSTE